MLLDRGQAVSTQISIVLTIKLTDNERTELPVESRQHTILYEWVDNVDNKPIECFDNVSIGWTATKTNVCFF